MIDFHHFWQMHAPIIIILIPALTSFFVIAVGKSWFRLFKTRLATTVATWHQP